MKKNARGLYQKQITIVVDGVKKQKAFYGKTIAEVNKKMLEYKGEVERGRTFGEVADEWWEEHQAVVTYGTAKSYKAPYNRLNETFGSVAIKAITPTDVNSFILSFASQGYAQKTVKNLLLVTNLIFAHAVYKKDLEFSPTTHIKVPKNLKKSKRKIPTPSEIEIVRGGIECTFGLFACFLLFTGCRKGEALALQFKDIDRENKIINITKSVYYISNKAIIKPPKTDAGYRQIVLIDKLANILPTGEPDNYVFGNSEPISAKKYIVQWKKYQKETDTTITAHQLRHAYVTRLYDLNIDEKSAQQLVGHADGSTMRSIYTHLTDERKKATAKQLENF